MSWAPWRRVLRRRGRGAIEIALTAQADRVTDEELATLTLLVEQSRRPVTFLALFARPGRPPGSHEEALTRVGALLGRDRAVPQVSCRPLRVQFTLKNPFILATMATWAPAFNRPLDEQVALYRSAEFRSAWKAEMDRRRMGRALWPRITVRDAASPAIAALAGRSIADIAATRGVEAPDALLDLALEDGLETLFDFPVFNQDPDAVRPLVTDPRFLIGLSDGGAHVDQLCDAGYATYLLGKWVRQWQALTLEEGVRRLTSEIADFFGIPGRGRLVAGAAADLVLFDPATVDDEAAGVRPRPARRRQASGGAGPRHPRHGGGRRGRLPGGQGDGHAAGDSATLGSGMRPIISADSHITEPPGTYVDRIDHKFRDRAPRWSTTPSAAISSSSRGSTSRSPWDSIAAAGKNAEELTDVRRPLRGLAPGRLGSRRAPGRPGPRRGQRRDPVPDGGHDALQPSRLRLQARVLSRPTTAGSPSTPARTPIACSGSARPRCARSKMASAICKRSRISACAA